MLEISPAPRAGKARARTTRRGPAAAAPAGWAAKWPSASVIWRRFETLRVQPMTDVHTPMAVPLLFFAFRQYDM